MAKKVEEKTMVLIPWEPFREREMLQGDMNRLFNRMMSAPSNEGRSDILPAGYSFMPTAEMHETPDDITLKMEVPCIEAKDLDITPLLLLSENKNKRQCLNLRLGLGLWLYF
jgi:hypothetical protein